MVVTLGGGTLVMLKNAVCGPRSLWRDSLALLGLCLLVVSLSACNKLVGKGTVTSATRGGTLQVSTTVDQSSGKTFASLAANSTTTQVVEVPPTSPVAGTSLAIPPGTLGVATDVTIELAAPLVNPGNSAALGVDGGSTVVGKAVSIQPTQPTDALKPFTVSLAVPSASGLNLADVNANLYVMYKVQNVQAGTVTLGLIPRSALTVNGGTLSFTVSFFGAFQAAVSVTPITVAVQVPVVSTSILTQHAAAALPPLAVTARAPFIVKAGSTVTITGTNFRPTMTLALGGKPVANLKVMSDTSASFTAPTYQGFGLSSLTADQDGSSTQSAVVYYTGTYADYPVSSKVVSEICAGEKFYDGSGTLQTGTRNCTIPAACTADGATSCVANTTYTAALTTGLASKLLSSATVAGVAGNVTLPAATNVLSGVTYGTSGASLTGTLTVPTASYVRVANGTYGAGGTATTPTLTDCATDGTLGCVTVTGYPSAKLANFSASNIAVGITIAGVVGSGTSSPVSCSADGATSCVANATYTAALTTGLASKVLSSATVAGVAGNVTLPAAGNVLAAVSYGISGTGATGTLTLPTAANVRTVNGAYGVGGTGTAPALADCAADGGTSCVAVASFTAATTSGLASKVLSGSTVAGVGGNVTLPSVTNVLTPVTYGVSGTGSVGTLTLPTAANVRAVNGAYGVGGTATAPILADCASDGQTGCVTSGILPAAAITGFSTWNIRAGTTLAGVAGTLKTNCRNAVNSTYFNYDGAVASLPATGVTSGTAFDYWDTVDDYYGFAANKVTAWSSDTYCDSSTWTDVTTTNGGTTFTTCALSSANCQYKDNITNLVTTKVVSASSTWSAAVNACASSTYGGYAAGTWRLPTQKELMSQYEHGIVSLVSANFMTLVNMQNYFWSSSTNSTSTTNAWGVGLAGGTTDDYNTKAYSFCVSCVK